MVISKDLFVRRRAMPRFSSTPERIRRRLTLACKELSEAEAEMAEQLGMAKAPCLLMVDEEEAVIIFASDRAEIS